MERIGYGKYNKEFREEAVQLIADSGLSVAEVSRRLSVPQSSLRSWLNSYKKGNLSEVGVNRRQLSETELEIARLKRELSEVKMERDILKKAAAYFAKESQKGTR